MATDPLLDAADRLYGLTLAEFTRHATRWSRSTRATRSWPPAQGAQEAVAGGVGGQPAGPSGRRAGRPGAGRRRGAAPGAGRTSTAPSCAQLTRQRRQLTAAVTAQARGLAAEHGQRVTQAVADQVEATLTAAMVDPAAAAAVRTGLLVNALQQHRRRRARPHGVRRGARRRRLHADRARRAGATPAAGPARGAGPGRGGEEARRRRRSGSTPAQAEVRRGHRGT